YFVRNAVTWSDAKASKELLALARSENAEHLAVLRDGTARDLNAVVLGEDFDDRLVGQGVRFVLGFDDLLDRLLDAFAGDVVFARAADRRIEEILQLEEPLRRVHVFVRGDTADGRFVHPDRVGDVTQDHRLEKADSFFEEVALLLDDALGHADD